MKPEKLEIVFENCLQRLQNGEDLESILAEYPAQAGQLRPLLMTVIKLQSVQVPAVSPVIRNAGRARFLAAAGGKRKLPARVGGWKPVRALVTSLLVVVVLSVSLLGTGLASAQALPGDSLYPVKRAVENTRLALTNTSLDRLKLEESFGEQRALEAALLVDGQRNQEVSFFGMLEGSPALGWQVDGIAVHPKDPRLTWDTLTGAQVEVVGHTRSDGIEVEELRLRLFHLSGEIEQVNPTEWIVSGALVDISPVIRITGDVKLGSTVHITAVQMRPNRFLALSIQIVPDVEVKAADDDEIIHLSDWVILSEENENKGSDRSGGEDSSSSSGSNGSSTSSGSSDDSTPEPGKTDDKPTDDHQEKTPEPEKTDDHSG